MADRGREEVEKSKRVLKIEDARFNEERALSSILTPKNGFYDYANLINSSLMSQCKGSKSEKPLMPLEEN